MSEDKEKERRKKELQQKADDLKDEIASLGGQEGQLYGQLGELQDKLRTANIFTEKQLEADIENVRNQIDEVQQKTEIANNELTEVLAELNPLAAIGRVLSAKASQFKDEILEKALMGVPGINGLMKIDFTKKIILKIINTYGPLVLYVVAFMFCLCCFVVCIGFTSLFAGGPGQDLQVQTLPSLECGFVATNVITNLDVSDSKSGECMINYTMDSFNSRTEAL